MSQLPMPPTDPAGDCLALVGAAIFPSPSEEPIHNGVVVIHKGKINAVGDRSLLQQLPQSLRSIDCSGSTITAGFFNSHVHLFERKWANAATIPAPELTRQLQDMLTRYGFTSMFDRFAHHGACRAVWRCAAIRPSRRRF